jgi:hypothetical protein
MVKVGSRLRVLMVHIYASAQNPSTEMVSARPTDVGVTEICGASSALRCRAARRGVWRARPERRASRAPGADRARFGSESQQSASWTHCHRSSRRVTAALRAGEGASPRRAIGVVDADSADFVATDFLSASEAQSSMGPYSVPECSLQHHASL